MAPPPHHSNKNINNIKINFFSYSFNPVLSVLKLFTDKLYFLLGGTKALSRLGVNFRPYVINFLLPKQGEINPAFGDQNDPRAHFSLSLKSKQKHSFHLKSTKLISHQLVKFIKSRLEFEECILIRQLFTTLYIMMKGRFNDHE